MTNTMYPTVENTKILFIIIRNLDELIFYRMKSIQDKQQGLRMRLRNNQRELQRLMTDFENFGAVVVTGSEVTGMENWLVQGRPRRHAPVVQSPDPLDNTQTTDGSTQPTQSTNGDSQISYAASEALAAVLFLMIIQVRVKTTKTKSDRSTQRLDWQTVRHLILHI